MIEVTQQELQEIRELELKVNKVGGGVKINARVIYNLWPQLFQTRKVPNGCGKCMRNDIRAFLDRFAEEETLGNVKILTD